MRPSKSAHANSPANGIFTGKAGDYRGHTTHYLVVGSVCAACLREAVSENRERRYPISEEPIYRITEVEKGGTPMTRTTVTKGSGNVFRDLGFSEEKSAELILKSSLLQALQETIKDRGWKQVEAADQLGIDQAKVSKLLAGQMAGFSIERLVSFLSLLGQDVEVTVRKAPRGRRLGTVRARTTRKLAKVVG
jgi:predicted XRE-type DNA-binding protein